MGHFIFGAYWRRKNRNSKNISNHLFNNEKELLTIDMSEFSEKHSISKLIGSPPGYVGFDDGGRLTKEVRESLLK